MPVAPGSPVDRYRLGDLVLDVRQRQVTRRGRPLKLGKLTFDLLRALVESAPAVLTRDELISLVWVNRLVNVETVSQRVKLLREALSDDAHHPRYIEVVRGQGVRLIPPVEPLPGESLRPRWQRSFIAVTGSLLIATLSTLAYWQYFALDGPADAPEPNARAYAFYTVGLAYERGGANNQLRLRQYQRAVEEDPEFALAWAALADVYSDTADFDRPDEFSLFAALALDAAEEALSLAPDLPEAHVAMGRVYDLQRDYDAALRYYTTARSAMPESASVSKQRALALANLGRFEAAAAEFVHTIEMDPGDSHARQQQGIAYAHLRDYERAERAFDRVMDLVPDHPYANGWKVRTLMARGDIAGMTAAIEAQPFLTARERRSWEAAYFDRNSESALVHLADWETEGFFKNWSYAMTYRFLLDMPSRAESYLQAARDDSLRRIENDPTNPRFVANLAEVAAYLGEPNTASDLAREALERAEEVTDSQRSGELCIDIFWALVAAEEYDSAIETLDTYLSNPGWWSIEGLLLDPRLDSIRERPDFQALVERHRRD